jgi:hypothetical protein
MCTRPVLLLQIPPGATGAEVSLHGRDWSNYLDRFIAKNYAGDESALLGEIQLSFVFFLVSQIYEGMFWVGELECKFSTKTGDSLKFASHSTFCTGFEQWKQLVNLLCTCYTAVAERTQFYLNLQTVRRVLSKLFPFVCGGVVVVGTRHSPPPLSARAITVLFHQVNECPPGFFTDIVTAENFLSHALSNLFANIDENDNADVQLKAKSEQFKRHLQTRFGVQFCDVLDDQ